MDFAMWFVIGTFLFFFLSTYADKQSWKDSFAIIGCIGALTTVLYSYFHTDAPTQIEDIVYPMGAAFALYVILSLIFKLTK